ncbi:MAG: TonB-dependent receptor plug domain-containing protein, partial [Alphaproteobacteria bacterium]|nr:TonB-dependent receptor plug domain-containing protein [Alphaproteobacteria bacterium]
MSQKSIRSGLLAGTILAAALYAAPALAQDSATSTPKAAKVSKVDNVETIVVTGSISRNKAAATASPIVSLSADDLAKRGQDTVSDALQLLPATNAGSVGSNWGALGGFSTGASAVSLRGFNDGYTLTLFNGLRTAYYPLADDGYRNIVDLNTIPDSLVQNIDVLQDGASATYGADAIAGVVNVIIKKEIQGLHVNMSDAISQQGDAGERRIDATWGMGKLSRDGYNFYINAEYQKNDPLYLGQRGYPYNTANRSGLCGISNGKGTAAAGATTCGPNNIINGIQASGALTGFGSTQVGFVAPTNPATLLDSAPYQALNPALGCGPGTPIALTAAQQAQTPTPAPAVACQQDIQNEYSEFLPDIQRTGFNARFTKDIGSRAQVYIMGNYLETKTYQTFNPLSYAGGTTLAGFTPGGAQVFVNNIYLPVYTCAQGVGAIDGNGNLTGTGCNATNGTLNPNNPFAAQGQLAHLKELTSTVTAESTDAKTYRFSGGLSGNFGSGWDYDIEGTTSWIDLTTVQTGDIYLQGLMNAVAQGTFNFANQNAN